MMQPNNNNKLLCLAVLSRSYSCSCSAAALGELPGAGLKRFSGPEKGNVLRFLIMMTTSLGFLVSFCGLGTCRQKTGLVLYFPVLGRSPRIFSQLLASVVLVARQGCVDCIPSPPKNTEYQKAREKRMETLHSRQYHNFAD